MPSKNIGTNKAIIMRNVLIIIALFVPIFFECIHIIAYIIYCIYTEKWINRVDKLCYEYYRVNL